MEKNRLSPLPSQQITFNAEEQEIDLKSNNLQGTNENLYNGNTVLKSPNPNVALTSFGNSDKLAIIDEKDETVKEQSFAAQNQSTTKKITLDL